MSCRMDECRQGRAECPTPITCSGFDADEAIAHLKLHRLSPVPIPKAETKPLTAYDWIAAAVVVALAFGAAGVLIFR